MAYLELHEISKRFGPVQALSAVSLSAQPGAIHAIVGENGAGKSTLMKVLYGLEQPDAGYVELEGRRLVMGSPREAIARGIGMVHQKFQLIPSFTVTENITLGAEPMRGGMLDLAAARRRVRDLVEAYGLGLDPDRPVGQLSMGERQRVEIAKILYQQARVLIFDEATSVLTPQEAEGLFRVLEQFRAAGKSILYITHKFAEVFRLAQTVTVLRAGRVIGSYPAGEVTPERLARDMVGGENAPATAADAAPRPPVPVGAQPVLTVRGLWVLREDGLPALRGIDLDVHAGEIVGVAGVEGNGQRELAAALVGLIPVQKGEIRLDGAAVQQRSVRERRRHGISWIPPDRYQQGSALQSSLAENLIAGEMQEPPFSRGGVLQWRVIGRHVQERLKAFDVRAAGPQAPAGTLSGGNLQKVIAAREVRPGLRLLVASNPANGLDFRAAAFVREQLRQLRGRGLAVLLVSADLDEVLALSDRVLVLYRGCVAAAFNRGTMTREQVGLAMTGQAAGKEVQVSG